jgi:hypothetical protein
LFVIARIAARMALDFWWFDTVTPSPVWGTRVFAQILLGGVALVIGGAVLFGSARIAIDTGPAENNRPNRLVAAYRHRMGSLHRWLILGGALILTLRGAVMAMSRWRDWLLFQHAPGLNDPVSHVGWDLGYHLFRLPFLGLASGWLRLNVLIGLGIAAVAYVANGALKIPRGGRRSADRAVKHLGRGVAVLATLQALDYVFVRWPDNATARFGAFYGAGFTQVRFIIPSLWLLAAVAVITAALTFRATSTGHWRPALIAFGVWGTLHLLLLFAVPALVNNLVVEPAEGEIQLPYIAENLDSTRSAYSLGSVEQVTRQVADGLDSPPSPGLSQQIDKMPLFTESSLVAPLQVLKGTTATRISNVDLDRYEIDGERRPVFIAARNADRADLPEKGWVQQTLVYTHGDGVVVVPADSTSPDGRPDVDAFTNDLEGYRSELYFGEGLAGWYAIVGTNRTELGGSVFSGDTAIPLGSFWRRLAVSLAVGEIDPLVSAELGPESQLLYRRSLAERLGYLAPFLSFDANPYPVVTDGKITWLVDGYTRTSHYPYSQYARDVGLSSESGMASGSFNYMHASIRATVDAYDGTVHLYRTEAGGADDPILDAWSAIFPGLIEPISEMPEELRDHLLYPQDMLTVQTSMLGRYHVSDPETLFSGADSWAISAAAGNGVARSTEGSGAANPVPAPAVSLFMPSSEPLGGHWTAIRPFGPGSASNPTSTRDELIAIAVADHDDPERLILERVESGSGRPVSSPIVAQAAIDTDDDLAALFTLLNANGSAVQFGPMTPLPIENALVWARSIVVTGTAESTVPSLYGVAGVSNGLVGQGETTSSAVTAAVVGSDLTP